MATPDQKKVKFNTTPSQIETLSLQHTTQGIQNDFNNANITSTFIHSNCPICLEDQLTATDITQTNCNHYSCNNCMLKYLNKEFNGLFATCFTCRSSFTEVITITNGTEYIEDYINRLHPPLPIALSRNFTCGSRNILNAHGDVYGNFHDENTRSQNHMKLISSKPLMDFIINTNSEFNIIHTYNHLESLGCVTAISSQNIENGLGIDYIIVLDVSGSMLGDRINTAIDVIKQIINTIKMFDRLTVVTFDDYVNQLFPLQHITPLVIDQLMNLINEIETSGSTFYTDSFHFMKHIFDETISNNAISTRGKVIIFMSDGCPSVPPNLNILNNLFDAYPEIIMHTISIGNSVSATSHLVPLLCDRGYELGKYYDCPTMEIFNNCLVEIIGEATIIYATNLVICFTNAQPLSSLAIQVDLNKFEIQFPVLMLNSACNIPFKILAPNIEIKYSFKKDENIITGSSLEDIQGLLPPSISIYFPRFKFMTEKINLILTTSMNKREELIELLELLVEEYYNNYYQELFTSLTDLIVSLQVSNRNNNQSQNRAISIQASLSRDTSNSSESQQLSQNIRTYSQNI